jgi:prophage tail gpP-like protein
MITVKVMQIPGTIREVALEDGSTVADALAAAEMAVSAGYTLKVDGNETSNDTVLSDGQNITINTSAKGNA